MGFRAEMKAHRADEVDLGAPVPDALDAAGEVREARAADRHVAVQLDLRTTAPVHRSHSRFRVLTSNARMQDMLHQLLDAVDHIHDGVKLDTLPLFRFLIEQQRGAGSVQPPRRR